MFPPWASDPHHPKFRGGYPENDSIPRSWDVDVFSREGYIAVYSSNLRACLAFGRYPPRLSVYPMLSWSIATLAFLCIIAGSYAGTSTPTATTLNGTYAGRYVPEYDQDFFLGMLFAQPPVGALRFANPQSLNTSFSGIRDATEYSVECVGYGVSSSLPEFKSGPNHSTQERSMGFQRERGLSVPERYPACELRGVR